MNIKSIADELRRSTNRNPEKPAVICGEESLTYAEFDRLTDAVASRLVAAGIQPGDRIALHMLNTQELALSCIGCVKAGGIAVPINTRLKGREIDYILGHSGAVAYIGAAEFYACVANLREHLVDLRRCYVSGDRPTGSDVLAFAELLRPLANPDPLPTQVGGQTAIIIYTSGTTAQPKGVTHSHETLLETARVVHTLFGEENHVLLVTSSMAHILGFGCAFLAGLLNGATVVLLPQVTPESVLQAFHRHRCTQMAGLPTFFHQVAQAQSEAKYDVSSGRYFLCGGDSVSPALQEEFERVMGAPICEGYGSTEAVPLTFNRPGRVRVGSIGEPVDGVSVRLLDTAGREVGAGEIGEICIQSKLLMMGYWKDPGATADVVRDGWFHTGDLARRDSDGFYWFSGRAKQIIIRGGSNISPQEVEAVLLEHPAVREVAVIGRPDPIWGEIVVAYVSVRDEQSLTAAELIAFASERLSDYKVPAHVVFRQNLPTTATGKLDRRALRDAEQIQKTL